MTVAAVSFTCTRDAQPLRVAIHSIRARFPGVPVWLSVEEHDTMFPAVDAVTQVRASGRRGNLNGFDHLRQAFALYSRVIRETGADWLLKFDSDVVVRTWPDLSELADYAVVGITSDGRGLNGIYGAVYCLSAAFVFRVEAFLRLPAAEAEVRHALHIRPGLPEDLTVWRLVALLGQRGLRLPEDSLRFIDSEHPDPGAAACVALGPYGSEQALTAARLERPPSMLELNTVRANLLHACLTYPESPSRS